jgi:hypothetical protein
VAKKSLAEFLIADWNTNVQIKMKRTKIAIRGLLLEKRKASLKDQYDLEPKAEPIFCCILGGNVSKCISFSRNNFGTSKGNTASSYNPRLSVIGRSLTEFQYFG